jgi:hypothetical protein
VAESLRVVIADVNRFDPARVATSGLRGLADPIEAFRGSPRVVSRTIPEEGRG